MQSYRSLPRSYQKVRNQHVKKNFQRTSRAYRIHQIQMNDHRLKCPEPKELFSWSYRQNEWNKNDAYFMPRQGKVSIGVERFPVNYHWKVIALAFLCKYLPSNVALFQFLCAQYYKAIKLNSINFLKFLRRDLSVLAFKFINLI